MGQKLYLECSTGISGDMLVAALLDLGADKDRLLAALKTVPADGFDIRISRVKKSGLDCCDFDVILDAKYENHDHDMDYLYGHDHHHHDDEEDHEHHHHEEAGHGHHHDHEHRHLSDVLDIIDRTQMTPHAREIAGKIFDIVAEAESRAHGEPKDEVHFHEVGAIDSIVDIASIAICIDDLGITDVIIPRLTEGTGSVRCAHGILPVPVPAVVNIAEAYGLNLRITDTEGELVTPTGAAAAAALRTSDRLPDQFRILRTGLGAGKRAYERPSILRAMLIDTGDDDSGKAGSVPDRAETGRDLIWKLETNIDDSTGEQLGHVMNLLLQAGARDVHYSPIYMKKNRPAYELNVICSENQIRDLENIIFKETTTIGIRRTSYERTVLDRKEISVKVPEGEFAVKMCRLPDGETRFYPEYDSVSSYAEKSGKSFAECYRDLVSGCHI